MPLGLHDLAIPAFQRGFASLAAILGKARGFVDGGPIATAIVSARLYPDMLPLAGQIRRASSTAAGVAINLGGVPDPRFADDEARLADLEGRVARTVRLLDGVARTTLDAAEEVRVHFETPAGGVETDGRTYVLGYALPNFYFHVTTAYAILRHVGVPLGKLDYLGPL